MTNKLLQIKIKQRLNKLASMDYDNLECWKIAEAFNKAQLEWVRRSLLGSNARGTQVEQNINVVDDLQVLLKEFEMSGRNRADYFETSDIPNDYLHFTRVSAKGITDCCPSRILSVYLAEEANADELLTDNFKSPSFEWGETFCTIMDGKIKIYTNGEFEIESPKLIYYRAPKPVKFKDCVNIDTGAVYKTDVLCEFKDDVIEILCDEAAAILAGDIESMGQYQREIQSAGRNS